MFSPQVRLILVAAAAALGTAFLLQHRSTGFLLLAAAALWAWGYFRHGTIHAAVTAYRRGDVERARRLLAGVPDPARLTPQDQAYYHWLRGSILVEDGHLEPAKTELGLAVEGRLRTENDRSLVHCQLAELAIREGAWAAAQEHLRQATVLRHRSQVSAVIQQLQEKLERAVCPSHRALQHSSRMVSGCRRRGFEFRGGETPGSVDRCGPGGSVTVRPHK